MSTQGANTGPPPFTATHWRAIRAVLGFTQQQIADLVEIARPEISRFERGKTRARASVVSLLKDRIADPRIRPVLEAGGIDPRLLERRDVVGQVLSRMPPRCPKCKILIGEGYSAESPTHPGHCWMCGMELSSASRGK